MQRTLITTGVLWVLFAGCGEDIGASIRAADTCRMIRTAATTRRATFHCDEIQLNCNEAGGCSDTDTAACVMALSQAGSCDAINTTFSECPIRCRR